ncbi:MAG: Ig-like domain-containing protein [Candidatus Bathyarchaeia archaeon]
MRKFTIKHLVICVLIVLAVTSIQTLPAGGCGCSRRRDLQPPKIHYVLQHPLEPEYEDSVLVLAYITDLKSGVDRAILRYTVNGQQTVTVTMRRNESVYFAEVPPLPYNSTVVYTVLAYDKAGNKACSKEYTYTVGDFHPPVITYIQQTPAKPNYNDTVTIVASAMEPANASGVKELTLSYNHGAGWENITMEPTGTIYSAVIPEFPLRTIVQYKVYATDMAGNTAAFDIYSYNVEDQYLPVAVITSPKNGELLSKSVNVAFYVYDDNFHEAKLSVDDKPLASWNKTGAHMYTLNTSTLPDGAHKLTLEAFDRAGNKAEHTMFVTADNTAPTAEIKWPLDGSFVSGLVLVEIRAEDVDFKHVELRIGGATYCWEAKQQTFPWNTNTLSDGEYQIVLTAFDKAGNRAEKRITVKVDNTSPTISNLTWTPKEPTINETVKVYAQITDEGSGVKEAFLWFRCLNSSEWQKTPMTMENGNWIATIQGFGEGTTVIFYVEGFDKTGNAAKSPENYYVVVAAVIKGAAGFPLYWLALAVLAIFAVLASTAYYLRRKKRAAQPSTFLVSGF